MRTINLQSYKLSEVVSEIETTSLVHQMISLMANDSRVGDIQIANSRMFKENRADNFNVEKMDNWDLSFEEQREFFTAFKDKVSRMSDEDLSRDVYYTVLLKDFRLIVTEPPLSADYSLNSRKYLEETLQLNPNSQMPGVNVRGKVLASIIIAEALTKEEPRVITIEDTAELQLGR